MNTPGTSPRRPWVSVNLAVSADGKTGNAADCPSGWTSRADHDRLLELRQTADAILVGRRTLIADRMTMTCPGRKVQPLRCVVARDSNLPAGHPLFTRPGGDIHWLASEHSGSLSEISGSGVTFHCGTLAAFLTTLSDRFGVGRVHCEGGGTLIRMLAEMDAIDELHLTIAGHTVFGGGAASTLTGIPGAYPAKSLKFAMSTFLNPAGTGECYLTYRRQDQ